MVEYGMIISSSIGNFVHRLTYDPTMWTPAMLIIAAAVLVIYGICKL
jgi:uncharacterized membrane protein YoaK (UPF0700 family)